MNDSWKGLNHAARARLSQRNYQTRPLSARISHEGVEVRELMAADRGEPAIAAAWIPGVEFFARRVFPQRHRGYFGEFARQGEGVLGMIGLWPRQWATATMSAGTAKGFHIHPPFIPESERAETWFRRLYGNSAPDYTLRPYDREQWDSMFFVQGVVEMILVDERAGLDRRVMRFIIEGDDLRGPNNAGVVIPAGVAHALKVESSKDLIMVYGTSTSFEPAFEGRISNAVETAELPVEWQDYMRG